MKDTAEQDSGDSKMIVSPETSDSAKVCFTALPSRRFWAKLVPSACRLCPSMDLIVLGLTGGSLVLHRTVTAQKLATVPATTGVGGDDADEATGDAAASDHPSQGAFFTAFRPDGRLLAVSSSNHMTLHSVENILSSYSGSNDNSTSGTEGTASVTFTLVSDDRMGSDLANFRVTGLCWAHRGNPHPAWDVPPAERDDGVYWEYAKRFCDQSTLLLPPSEYHNPQHAPDEPYESTTHYQLAHTTMSSILPSSDTLLNVLCVTTDQSLQLYLHGRFPILAVPLENQIPEDGNVETAISNNLDHILIYSRGSKCVTVYSIPEMPRQRYSLQMLSALSCSMLSHISAIQTSVHEVAGSWKSSLKPLDLKLDLLTNLLRKYGLQGSTRTYLVQYILSGHTRAAPTLANVMDQFFTHVQMNDQLLLRMERTLSVAVQNVEVQFRKGLLSPTQALYFQANEIHGLAVANANDPREEVRFLSVDMTKEVLELCTQLYMLVEAALTHLIEARFRLQDLCAWLRSVGSQIKANGTAPNSVQRQNAKARRVADVVVERMLKYLQVEDVRAHGVAELVLGLRFACQLNETNLQSSASSGQSEDPVVGKKRGSILEIVNSLGKTFQILLDGPRNQMKKSMVSTRLMLQSSDHLSLVTITTRLGMGGVDPHDVPFGEEQHVGFFAPDETEHSVSGSVSPRDYKEWCVFAEAMATSADGPRARVMLYAMPLTWTDLEKNAHEKHGIATNECWAADLRLPKDYVILEIKFYGDDGKSTLSAGQDGGAGKERRHALGLLVERPDRKLEIWLVAYAGCSFYRHDVSMMSDGSYVIEVDANGDKESAFYAMHPMPEEFDEFEDSAPEGVLYSKTRVLSEACENKLDGPSTRLLLSGSRGIGVVLTDPYSVELFDLEEDEESESEE